VFEQGRKNKGFTRVNSNFLICMNALFIKAAYWCVVKLALTLQKKCMQKFGDYCKMILF
jgi:hypothetical protein